MSPSHPDNLVPVDSVLFTHGDACVFDEAPKLVAGHSQFNAGIIGSQVQSHPVPVDFKSVEPVNPYRSAGVEHSIASPFFAKGSTLFCFAFLNALRRSSVPMVRS